jgi:hypothetical protein
VGGEQATEGITVVTGIHGGEEVGSGFVMGAVLFGDPVHASAHDLARRARLHTLDYFSFRDYLAFRHGEHLERLRLEDLLSGNVEPDYLRAGRYFTDYLGGCLLPFALEEPDPLPLLAGTIQKIIERDIPATLRLHLDEIPLLREFLAFVGRSAVDGINYSTLSANLGITKYKADHAIRMATRVTRPADSASLHWHGSRHRQPSVIADVAKNTRQHFDDRLISQHDDKIYLLAGR